MFTGLVSDLGRVVSVSGDSRLRRIRIASSYDPAGIRLGASVACSGPCLTVVGLEPGERGAMFDVEAASETLSRTTVGDWREGTSVNLERSLRVGDELGGHIVTGHIDDVATITSREEVTANVELWGPTARFAIRAPTRLMRFIAAKGSVCLDGTSLTVNQVSDGTFSVLLIPHTLAVTTWGERQAGDRLNIEIDLMARYAARLTEGNDSLRS